MKSLQKRKPNEKVLNIKWSIEETEKTNTEEIEVIKSNLSKILLEFNRSSLKDKEKRKAQKEMKR